MKWYKKDVELLKKKVNSYNSKIRRLEKKGVSKDLIPERIRYKDIKSSITDRESFNNEIALIKDFTNRYSMHMKKNDLNNELPLWKIRQMERTKEIDNKITKREYKHLIDKLSKDKALLKSEVKRRQLEYLKKQFKDVERDTFDFNGKTFDDLEKLQDYLLNKKRTYEGRLESYRKGYLSSLNKASSKEEYDEIKGILDQLTDEELYEQYYMETDLDPRYNYLQIIKYGTGNIKTVRDKWMIVLNKKLGREEGYGIDSRFD